MQTYNFIVSHVSGEKKLIADSLSRYVNAKRDIQDEELSSEDPRVFFAEDLDFDLKEHQWKDSFLKEIIYWLTNDSNKDQKYEKQSFYYELKDDILYRKHRFANKEVLLPVIPFSLRDKVFHLCHEKILGAHHGGFTKTYGLLVKSVYFPNMKKYVYQKCKECLPCQVYKKRPGSPLGTLQTHPSVPPFYRITIDIAGQYNADNILRHRYFVVCIDECTRFCITESIADCQATTIANFLYEKVILRYGLFYELALDRAPAFKSQIFKELMNLLDVKIKFADVQGHYSIGTAEVCIKNIENQLKLAIDKKDQGSWIELLPLVTFSHNITVNASLGYSPFELLHGFTPRLLHQAILTSPCQFEDNKARIDQLSLIRDKASENLYRRFQTAKKSYDTRHKQLSFDEGDQVWIYDATTKKGQSKAFSGNYFGPGVVIKKIHDNSYLVKFKTARGQEKIDSIAIDRLKKYFPSSVPSGDQDGHSEDEVEDNEVNQAEADAVSSNDSQGNVMTTHPCATDDTTTDFIHGVTLMSEIPSWSVLATTYKNINNTSQRKFDVNNDINTKISLFLGDIVKLAGDAIVNPTNEDLDPRGGADRAIHHAAGPELLEACKKIGNIKPGAVVLTEGYNLPSTYIIHTCGPRDKNPKTLQSCYEKALQLCISHDIKTIAFPAIATGVFGFPVEKAAKLALFTIRKFLEDNLDHFDKIVFCLYDHESFNLYLQHISCYFPVA